MSRISPPPSPICLELCIDADARRPIQSQVPLPLRVPERRALHGRVQATHVGDRVGAVLVRPDPQGAVGRAFLDRRGQGEQGARGDGGSERDLRGVGFLPTDVPVPEPCRVHASAHGPVRVLLEDRVRAGSLRLDPTNLPRPSVKFFCDINYDPFLLMSDGKKKYGFVVTIYEYAETIVTLWDETKSTSLRSTASTALMAAEFISANPQFVASPNSMDFVSDDGGETYNRQVSPCSLSSSLQPLVPIDSPLPLLLPATAL